MRLSLSKKHIFLGLTLAVVTIAGAFSHVQMTSAAVAPARPPISGPGFPGPITSPDKPLPTGKPRNPKQTTPPAPAPTI